VQFFSGTSAVTFAASQIGSGGIGLVIGNAATLDTLIVNGGSINLAGLSFITWATTDVISLNGTGGADTITGTSQSDAISGGLGNDTLIGGTGFDTARYASHDAVTGVFGADVIALGQSGADGSYTRLGQTGPVETDVLRGIENVTGSNRAEVIIGNELDNTLDGRGGNDNLDGGLGNDTLIGGTGFDTARYVSHDAVTGVFGGDLISLGQNGVVETDVLRGIENVTGSNRPEVIIGNEFDNTLDGRGSDDNLVGGLGNDSVNGGAGNDVYDFTGFKLGNDRFFDESGTNDFMLINSFNDILPQTGRDGNDLVLSLTTGTVRIVDHFNGHQIEAIVARDTGQSMVLANGLIGGNGSGIIAGSHKGETLDGRGGDDFLFAGDGRDRLIGGDGDDRLTGGDGPDTFVFGPGFGYDVVTDFSRADHIEFDGGVFQNFKQVQAASQQVGNDTVITLDANDSITLLGVTLPSLHASHFDFG
jgi:Ca2+-binding RTX toxin-like protein